MEIWKFNTFIARLHANTIYTIIYFISMFEKDMVPQIILSNSILLINNSSPKLIH